MSQKALLVFWSLEEKICSAWNKNIKSYSVVDIFEVLTTQSVREKTASKRQNRKFTDWIFVMYTHPRLFANVIKNENEDRFFFYYKSNIVLFNIIRVTFKYPVIDVELKDCRKDIPGVKKDLVILPFKRLTIKCQRLSFVCE